MSTKQSHAIIILFFLLLSIVLTIGRVGTAFDRFALLTPDLGVYASLAAVQDQPNLFIKDPVLSKEENMNSYNMVFVPVLKALQKLFGNYGTACAFLLPIFLFVHFTGYYLLGVSIFKRPWVGLLVSLLLSTPITTAYDFWGFALDALPRFIYQSLLPFVLLLSIRFGKDPKWWPVILGSLGLLNYVHPLSTPTWAAAVTLGLWVAASQVPFREKVVRMFVAGILLLLILAPFISNYLNSTVTSTSQVADYDQTIAILRSHISTMNGGGSPFLILQFLKSRTSNGIDVVWILVWVIGISGLIYGLTVQKEAAVSSHFRQVAAWMLGIFLVGGLIPTIEQILFAYLRQIPPEFEILRTLRYLVPLITLCALYTFRLAATTLQQNGRLTSTAASRLFTVASVCLLFVWGMSSEILHGENRKMIRQNIACLTQGRIVCDLSPQSMGFIDMMDFIREETPIGSSIFSEGQEVAIRYYALRPLVFTYKDGAPLAYTDPQALLEWSKTYEKMDRLAFIRKFSFRRKRFVTEIVNIARLENADYLLLSEGLESDMYVPAGISPVYTNDYYSLYKINGE